MVEPAAFPKMDKSIQFLYGPNFLLLNYAVKVPKSGAIS